MTATTEGRQTKRRDGRQFTFGVAAATKLPVGVLAAIASTGFMVNAAAVATHKVVGVTEFDIDNSAGADQITLASVGDSAYVVDNQTVAKTSATNTRPVAGKIVDVDADGVWIDI